MARYLRATMPTCWCLRRMPADLLVPAPDAGRPAGASAGCRPTCWCLRRMPADLVDALAARYRRNLVAAGRDVPADEFESTLTACQAYWAIATANWHLTMAPRDSGGDRMYWDALDFHLPSARQRVMMRIGDLSDAAARQPQLAPLAAFADQIRRAATTTWQQVEPLPLYPAFTGAGDG